VINERALLFHQTSSIETDLFTERRRERGRRKRRRRWRRRRRRYPDLVESIRRGFAMARMWFIVKDSKISLCRLRLSIVRREKERPVYQNSEVSSFFRLPTKKKKKQSRNFWWHFQMNTLLKNYIIPYFSDIVPFSVMTFPNLSFSDFSRYPFSWQKSPPSKTVFFPVPPIPFLSNKGH